jgi:hypothetical protein
MKSYEKVKNHIRMNSVPNNSFHTQDDTLYGGASMTSLNAYKPETYINIDDNRNYFNGAKSAHRITN